MKLVQSTLPGVVIVEPVAFGDDRGWFMETFNEPRWLAGLAELGLPAPRRFVQDNHSCSKAGVLRGLHYQLPPQPQGKLVRVVQGAAWDVAVDIRSGSPTFGRWFGAELSEDNRRQMWIPPGFAHGFCVTSELADFAYKCTTAYVGKGARAIAWNDPDLGIDWPTAQPLLSPQDSTAPRLRDATLLPEHPGA